MHNISTALRGINAWGIYQTAPPNIQSWPLLTAVLATLEHFVSHTESIALLLKSEWLLYAHLQLPTHPSYPPSPIDSIHDIRGTEKTI